MWKAIACDFDGTMTEELGRLSLEVIALIRESEKRGIAFILSSGRPWIELKMIQRVVGASGPLICENGGIVWDPKTVEKQVLGDQKKVLKACQVFTRQLGDFEYSNPRLRETDVVFRGHRSGELEPLIEKENLGVHLLESEYLTHVTDIDVDKGRALEVTAEILGIEPCEIAAIGDSHNDVALFMAAGAGYAVGNADPRLKAVATQTMSKAAGAGCAEAIRQILREE
ncbi:MAG: phosphoglycolate phosphatase [Candidatus Bathyarchaeota archaeon]|nr:MAG: phosphoglycolate phosphatase [Candidatus Bathyarchaeota archaeon]